MVLSYLMIAILLDWMLGDPYFFPHPVVLMGKLISLEERLAFKYCKNSRAEYIAGTLMVFINCFLSVAVPGLILYLLKGRAYQVFFIYSIYQAISARMLHYEASQVKKATERSLDEGRKRLSKPLSFRGFFYSANIVGKNSTCTVENFCLYQRV